MKDPGVRTVLLLSTRRPCFRGVYGWYRRSGPCEGLRGVASRAVAMLREITSLTSSYTKSLTYRSTLVLEPSALRSLAANGARPNNYIRAMALY